MSGDGDAHSAFDIAILADLRGAASAYALSPAEAWVLAALALHVDGDRLTPSGPRQHRTSHARLSAVTGYSTRTIRTVMDALEAKGAIEVVDRPSLDHTPGRYRVLPHGLRKDVPQNCGSSFRRTEETVSAELRKQFPPIVPIEPVEPVEPIPSALNARRRGSVVPYSPAVSGKKQGARKGKHPPERKPTSVALGLKDAEAHRVAKAIYDARLAAGHTEVSAPKARFLLRYAGAVYDLMHAPHPTDPGEILAAALDAIERGRRYLGPPALADIVTEHRQGRNVGRRNATDDRNRRTGAGDYTPAAVPFTPGTD